MYYIKSKLTDQYAQSDDDLLAWVYDRDEAEVFPTEQDAEEFIKDKNIDEDSVEIIQ